MGVVCSFNYLMIVYRYHTFLLITWDGIKSVLSLLCFDLVEFFSRKCSSLEIDLKFRRHLGYTYLSLVVSAFEGLNGYGKNCQAVKIFWAIFLTSTIWSLKCSLKWVVYALQLTDKFIAMNHCCCLLFLQLFELLWESKVDHLVHIMWD